MNENSQEYSRYAEIKKTQVRKRESPKSWKLVYIVGGKLVETIKDNAPYSLLAGLRKQKKQTGRYNAGELKMMPQKG